MLTLLAGALGTTSRSQELIWESVPPSLLIQPNQEKQGGDSLQWELIPNQSSDPTNLPIWINYPLNETTKPAINQEVNHNRAPKWELLNEPLLPVSADPPAPRLQPLNVEEVEAIAAKTPLVSGDYLSLLRLSAAVPTASILEPEQFRFSASNISAFGNATGTGNQNYAVSLDVGLSESFQISAYYSQADDPLNASLNGFSVAPANFWESYAAAARWRLFKNKQLSIAANGSLEIWNVGSGGDDSFARAGDDASPNIFNNSGQRVFTSNLVGSLTLPLSWQATDQLQLSVVPGVSWLPANQGAGQGGSGSFYGTTPYLAAGLYWQANQHLGLTATFAQPIGSGSNSFNADLDFSRVPIYSAGLNWDLNPRIGLRGQLTNGFGATPATALLALPSDNRLGYSASFVFTPDGPDTPQRPLTKRQRSLAKGGLAVNSALVPPDESSELWANADESGNVNGFVGYSLSNIFQLQVIGGLSNDVPQTTPQARLFANDGARNLRIGGKAVFFSPLRGAPFWGGGRITVGRNFDLVNTSGQGYLFAETMFTWEASQHMALNLNPKLAWSGAGNLWGLGLSTNVQLFPGWELVPEGNVVINQLEQSNGTLGLRWHATDSLALEAYGSTAASLLDIGQLINAEQVRWGGRVLVSF